MRWIIASLHISHSYNYHFIMWLSIQNMTILVHNQQHYFQVTGNLFAWSLSLVLHHPASLPSHWSSNFHLDRVENRLWVRTLEMHWTRQFNSSNHFHVSNQHNASLTLEMWQLNASNHFHVSNQHHAFEPSSWIETNTIASEPIISIIPLSLNPS